MSAHGLRLVDTESGRLYEGPSNVADALATIAQQEDVIHGLERDIRGWAFRFAELSRDKDAEARAHSRWPEAVECFAFWQRECHHPRSAWSTERFYLVLPFLSRRRHGREKVLQAIAGAAFDPFTYTLRNGREQRSDGWEKILENVGTFERFCNKAPRGWTPPA